MATTTAPYNQSEQPLPDTVEVNQGWSAVRRYWWIVLLTIVFTTIVGFAIAGQGGSRSTAEVQVYLGQPLSPSGATLGIAENQLNTALGLVTSKEFIRAAAKDAGIPASNISGNIKARQLEAPIAAKVAGTPQVVVIDVNLADADNAETVADSLATQLVDATNAYSTAKRELLDGQLQAAEQTKEQQAAAAQRARQQIESATPDSLPVWSMIAQLAQSQADTAELAVEERQTDINLLESIESSRVLTDPTAEATEKARPAMVLAVSVLIGLIIGTAVAILVARRNKA